MSLPPTEAHNNHLSVVMLLVAGCIVLVNWGHAVRTFAAEPPVTALAFAPDGTMLAAGSKTGVTLYAWPELKPVRELRSAVDDVHDLQFAPQQPVLAVSGGTPGVDGGCELFHWPSGESLCQITGHDDVVYAAAWSVTEHHLALGSLDSRVSVVTLHQQAAEEPLVGSSPSSRVRIQVKHREMATGHSKGVLAVCFLPGGQLLTAGMDQTIRLWELKGKQVDPLRTFDNHTDTVRGLIARPAAPDTLCMVASIGEDCTVRFWQPTIGRMVRFAKLDPAVPLAAEWLPAGDLLAVACDDGHVRTFDPDTAEMKHDIAAQSSWCYALAVQSRSGAVAVGGPDGVKRLELRAVRPE